MKKILPLVLCLSMLNCATMRRHPAVTGIVIGAAAGVTVGLLTQHHCPKYINGYPYDGNQKPCPYNWDPGPKK